MKNVFLNPKLYKQKTPRKHAGIDRQQEVYDYYRRYWNEHGMSPMLREVGHAVGLTTGTVGYHVDALVAKGDLVFDRDSYARGVRVVAYDQQMERIA